MMKWFQDHHVWTKLLAFTLAIVLWAIVIRGENPQRTMDIGGVPVQLIGESQIRAVSDLVVTGMPNSQMSVKVRGSFSRLGQISSNDIIVRADVSKFTVPGTFYVEYDVSTPIGVTYEGSTPTKIQVTFDKIVEKELDVVIEYVGELDEGLTVGKASVSPSTMMVRGTMSAMENAKNAVVKINLSDLNESFDGDMEYSIVDNDGKRIDSPFTNSPVDSVKVSVPIYMTKSVELSVTKIGNKYISESSINSVIEPENVTVYGEASVIRDIESINVGAVNVGNFVISDTEVYNITLPEGVEFFGNPISSCEVTTYIEEFSSAQIILKDFILINIPENMKPEIENDDITVTVRGTDEALYGLTKDDFKAVADLSVTQPLSGFQTLPLIITCAKDGVEVFGTSYSIVVNTGKE